MERGKTRAGWNRMMFGLFSFSFFRFFSFWIAYLTRLEGPGTAFPAAIIAKPPPSPLPTVRKRRTKWDVSPSLCSLSPSTPPCFLFTPPFPPSPF
ncbi:hypothetical protein IE53DRAFT_172850 [Violaceomyces palustris]|uniref:Uncharacterized protein n=1 Tax=Violaceomyces palustris TaxID=1673888 RepID=A0ACD0NSW2_9BASI|nr:hypothetical protein IE53DRAFT_172850 [Violaceomyces palustris]